MRIVVLVLLFISATSSCQSVPRNFHAPKSYALKDTQNTYWGRYFAAEMKAHPEKSGFYPLQAGTDALVARLASIRHAEKSLDVQYYIWHDDSIGRLLWHELLLAADRGVRVRLLLDDLNIGRYQDPLLVLDSHPHIEVRMFNPLANRKLKILDIFRFKEVNRRMHNKSLIVDNQAVIIGGRNIGREYFTASPEENFGDFDVWCFGPVVAESSAAFDVFWNDPLAVPVAVLNKRELKENEMAELRQSTLAAKKEIESSEYQKQYEMSDLFQKMKKERVKLYWGRAKIFTDSPEKVRGTEDESKPPMLNAATALPIKSQKEVFVVSPYFIPGKDGVEYFRKKVAQGVRIDVLTNSLASNDVGLVFAGYKKYRKDLIKAGVHLYEMKPRIKTRVKKTSMVASSGARLGLHGKVYIFDRQLMFVGSMNLDPRSVELNSELGVLFESPELADRFVSNMMQELPYIAYKLQLQENGKLEWVTREQDEIRSLYEEPEASLWKSFKSKFLSLFVPESLL